MSFDLEMGVIFGKARQLFFILCSLGQWILQVFEQ